MSITVAVALVAACAVQAASRRTSDNERRARAERGREAIRRFARRATPVLGAMAAASCGADTLGSDCVTQGLAQMGREHLTSISVACQLPAESWIVAFPADVAPRDIPELPAKYWPIIADSTRKGYTWCVSTETPQDSSDALRMGCTRLTVGVDEATVVRGSRFIVDLQLRPDGEGVLRGLTVPAR
jgi:hypothetical protein